jgi:hypothetical protein
MQAADYQPAEVADAEVFEIPVPGHPSIPYAIDGSGTIYFTGDMHPKGQQGAVTDAMQEGIEWIPLNAVQTFFPMPWLIAKCDGVDPMRVMIMHSLERRIRNRG